MILVIPPSEEYAVDEESNFGRDGIFFPVKSPGVVFHVAQTGVTSVGE